MNQDIFSFRVLRNLSNCSIIELARNCGGLKSLRQRKVEMNNIENTVERHYWRAVIFLVILILAGTGFWGVRRFAPAMFLGKPDLIAVPNDEHPQNQGQQPLNRPELLNVNTASTEELQTLPNIGEATAQKIVDYRTQHGDFNSVDDLQNVRGIGAKTLEKLKPFVDTK